ncbi:C1q and tumor necrosis factor-related protein 3 [Obelidium mucronatum]|nr:C1q and tumor necrosis factor-related protein 3 [Obelidium mucronatum]
MEGPLSRLRVVEFAGLAPVPFAGMMLSDFGAHVIRIDRVDANGMIPDMLARGKKSIAIDLRTPKGVEVVMRLISTADVVLDPFRPGVLESLNLANPRCILARLTGFGQTGRYAKMAGHDINYIGVTGILGDAGSAWRANILGDFAGGGLMCVTGILIALLEREKSGKGQVIDVSMVSGVTYLSTFLVKMRQSGLWNEERGKNMLDTGAHFYDTYKTKDGKYMAVGAIEPQFYKKLLQGLNLPFEEIFASKTRDEWVSIFHGKDACVTPVMDVDEVMDSHKDTNKSIETDNHIHWNPPVAPILSRTPAPILNDKVNPKIGQHGMEILSASGFTSIEISNLLEERIIRIPNKSRL